MNPGPTALQRVWELHEAPLRTVTDFRESSSERGNLVGEQPHQEDHQHKYRAAPRIVVRGRLYDSLPLSLGSSRSLMASPNMFRL